MLHHFTIRQQQRNIMYPLRHRQHRLISSLFLTILVVLSIDLDDNVSNIFAHAQPQPCGGSAYARVGNNFYIQGGATSGDNLLQPFWALDLTISWTTSKPAWSPLPLGPANAYHSAGYSADNKSFITFGRDTAADPQVIPDSWINIFNIATGTWSFSTNPPNMADNSRRDFAAVTNPSANSIYILGGDAGPSGAIATNAFDIFDPMTRTLTEVTTPLPGPQNISTYAAVWAPNLNAMIVIGGAMPTSKPQGLYLYHPDTGAWTTQATTGSFNFARIAHCAASNADGSLIAVFGGFTTQPGNADPNIYILDTATWSWTATPYAGRGRGNTACAVVDDTFLIWGGFFQSPNTVNGTPMGAEALLLFSLSKRAWLTTYTPSAALVAAGNHTTSGSGGNGTGTVGGSMSGNTSNGGGGATVMSAGLIGGLAAAGIALVVLAAYGASVWVQRRKNRKALAEKKIASGDDMNDDGHIYPEALMAERARVISPPRPPPPMASDNRHNGRYQGPNPKSEAFIDPRQSLEGAAGGSSGGYSSVTTPTSLQFLATSERGVGSESLYGIPAMASGYSGRQSYQTEAPLAPVYYSPRSSAPTPGTLHQTPSTYHGDIPEEGVYISPFSKSTSSVNRRSNDPQLITNNLIGYYPFNGVSSTTMVPPLTEAPEDQYHESYGMKHFSINSTQTGYTDLSSHAPTSIFDPRMLPPAGAPPVPKRPVSGPQGGEGFGNVEQTGPGAPHAILEHYGPIYQAPPPIPPRPT
ncbi:hypothetical protein BGZ98_001070 [Dissophora globulifera]|nr:hypothetical protein BGZ98_001070 [Dissophora globulifera]